MKRQLVMFTALFAICSSLAYAGYIQPQVVSIDLTTRFAHGDQWSARAGPAVPLTPDPPFHFSSEGGHQQDARQHDARCRQEQHHER